MPQIHLSVPVMEDSILYNLPNIKRDVLNDGIVEQGTLGCHFTHVRRRDETRRDEVMPYLRDKGQMFGVATPKPGPTRMGESEPKPRDALFISFSYRFIKFLFSKVSRPESPARPEWWIRTGARFTPTFSFILSKHFY